MNVKGSSLQSKIDFLGQRFGDQAAADLRAYLRDQGVDLVLAASWYPYDLFDQVLRYIAEHYLDGELRRLREVGRFSAEHALTSTYQVYLRRGDFPAFLTLVTKLHGSYYDTGRLTAELVAADHAKLVLEGAPRYYESDLQVAAGFYSGAAELMGCKSVRCRLERRDDRVRIHIEWQAPGR